MALFLLLGTPAAPGQSLEQPIETRNHRAVALPFLRLPPGNRLLAKGRSELGLSLSSSNDLRRFGPLSEDEETERLALSGRWGIQRGLTVWGELALLSRGGGVLDPFIDAWHRKVLQVRVPLRENTPYGRSGVALDGAYRFGSASGIGDIMIGLSGKAPWRGLTWSAAIKLPTGNPSRLLGSGAADMGLSLYRSFKLGRSFLLHTQVGAVFQGKATRLPMSRAWVDQEALSLVWLSNSKDAWVLQWQSEAAPIRTGVTPADRTHRILSLGYRRALGTGRTVEIFFTEDGDLFSGKLPQIANVGPDITLGVRFAVSR